jgi:hypothetical protein
MGVDAYIYFEVKEGKEPPNEWRETMQLSQPSAKNARLWEVGCELTRYFAPHYRRGWWPRMRDILQKLLDAQDDVATVWYGGDLSACELSETEPFTAADLRDYNLAWMQLGLPDA